MTLFNLIERNNNAKGKFVENYLYDYYSYWNGNDVSFLSADENDKQRFGENRDMVLPDLMIDDTENSNLFLVESKSRHNPLGDNVEFSISKKLEKNYQNFYNRIFPAGFRVYEDLVPTIIVFSICRYDGDCGVMKSYFMPIVALGDIKRKLSRDEYNHDIWILKERDISDYTYQETIFNFNLDETGKKIETEYSMDFYKKDRHRLIVDDKYINGIVKSFVKKISS